MVDYGWPCSASVKPLRRQTCISVGSICPEHFVEYTAQTWAESKILYLQPPSLPTHFPNNTLDERGKQFHPEKGRREQINPFPRVQWGE